MAWWHRKAAASAAAGRVRPVAPPPSLFSLGTSQGLMRTGSLRRAQPNGLARFTDFTCPTTEQVTTRAPAGTGSNRVEKRQNAKTKAGLKGSAKSKGKGKAAAAKSRLPLEDRKDDDDESEDGHDSDTGAHPEGSRSTEARLMACPYYKMDPIQHYRCVEKHKLDGFNRLKQHIERCHSTTLYYCALCWVKFKDAEARDGHMRSGGCERIAGPEDFTGDEINRLQNDVPRGLSDHDKWYWVWDNFFAAHPRPESPYVYEGIREPLSLLTSIAKRNANSQEFGDWLMARLRMPFSEYSTLWDDIIGQLLTLCHEHTRCPDKAHHHHPPPTLLRRP
ncbi:HET and ankyrin domain protein [Colletotrichum higginsianum]|nr:HET and ankyrin domain protein [Colletotrichum higginsianum]